jgi:hypothetical protein
MNPITAVIKGTTKAASKATKSAASKANDAIPKPSEAVYNLGLGIGPLLRSITDEMKRSNKTPESKDDKKNNQQLVGKKELASISTQMTAMVNVLKEIRNIGMMQLRGDQQRLLESRRQSFFDKETAQETRPQGGMLSALGGRKAGGDTPVGILKDMAGLFGGLPGLLKLGIGAGAAVGIWKYIFNDETRDLIKSRVTDILFGSSGGPGGGDADGEGGGVVGAFGSFMIKAFESEPVLTAAAAALALRMTGIWGAAKVVGKLGYNLGRLATVPTAAPTLAATTAVPNIPVAAVTNAPGVAATGASRKGLTPIEKVRLQQEIAGNNAAASASQKPAPAAAAAESTMSKLGTLATTATKWLGRGLGALGVGVSGYNSYNDYKEGKNWAGTLNAISAATGTGALVSLATPAAPIAAPVLGAISALTGVAGSITSYFEKGSTSNTPTPSSTQPVKPAGNDDDFFEKYKEMIGYTESRGQYGITNDLGFLGKYQFGAAALETLGYLKTGASKKVKSGESQRPVVDDPTNWLNGYTKEKFLSDQRAQDEAFTRMTNMNLRILKDAGVITGESTAQEIAGYLAGAHLGGAGGVIKYHRSGGGYNPSDVNGTSIDRYIQYGKNAFSQPGNNYDLFSGALKAAKGAGGMSSSSGITPSNIQGADAQNANPLAEYTAAINDWMRAMSGGFGVMNVDQSNKTNVIGQGGGGGDTFSTLSLSDSVIRNSTSSIALPA